MIHSECDLGLTMNNRKAQIIIIRAANWYILPSSIFASRNAPPAYRLIPPIMQLKKLSTPNPVALYLGSATMHNIGIILASPNTRVIP